MRLAYIMLGSGSRRIVLYSVNVLYIVLRLSKAPLHFIAATVRNPRRSRTITCCHQLDHVVSPPYTISSRVSVSIPNLLERIGRQFPQRAHRLGAPDCASTMLVCTGQSGQQVWKGCIPSLERLCTHMAARSRAEHFQSHLKAQKQGPLRQANQSLQGLLPSAHYIPRWSILEQRVVPNCESDHCLFSGMRASWLLLRTRGRTLAYHSHAKRMTSPSASYGVGISE